MSENTLDMLKKIAEAKKNKNSNKDEKLRPGKTSVQTRKGVKVNKGGGFFDK